MSSVSLVSVGVYFLGGLSFLVMILIVFLDFSIGKKEEIKKSKYH